MLPGSSIALQASRLASPMDGIRCAVAATAHSYPDSGWRCPTYGAQSPRSSDQAVGPLLVQGGVAAAVGDEHGRRAILYHPAVLDHQHPVGDGDGGEAVRDDEGGPVR